MRLGHSGDAARPRGRSHVWLTLFVLCCLLVRAHAAVRRRVADGDPPLPPTARAHCRVFAVASRTQTRVLILRNAYEQDAVDVYDQLPASASILDGTSTAARADAEDEKAAADASYVILLPAVARAAEWLRPHVDARHCYVHLVTESDSDSDSDSMTTSRVTRRLAQLCDRARHDPAFPFLLAAPPASDAPRDVAGVTQSGDLRLVTSPWRRYFHILGVNYFAGRVAPSLSPGQIEVFGLLHVGGAESEPGSDSAEMVFDVRERWRRHKRQRQVSVALNTSDFWSRGYVGYGRPGVQHAVVTSQKQISDSDELPHPCFLSGSALGAEKLKLKGAGDAVKCMDLIRTYVSAGNAQCPGESFCVLGGASQPQPFGAFYASGVLRDAVLLASRVLDHAGLKPLQLPSPPLSALREAAQTVCSLSVDDVAAADAATLSPAGKNATKPGSLLCLDLSYAAVLLEQVGVQDADERVYFVDHFEKQPSPPADDGKAGRRSPPELVAWLTGAFLYLEALQRKVSFTMEAELLAEQLSAGLPIGWNLSLLLFLAASCFLYFTTGRKPTSGRGYHRVVNGGAKAKYKDSTQSIAFVDDARE
ncbi:hypothetical protein BBJ28_00022725 [Nothophytophthora sp. Chile5]|nr:hypothetical protein BBJ28_00022725 [Nothophytophthora sp. Chile5]